LQNYFNVNIAKANYVPRFIYSVYLEKTSFKYFENDEWFSDELIHIFSCIQIEALKEKGYKVIIMPLELIQKVMFDVICYRQKLVDFQFFDNDIIFVPCPYNNHWTLIVIVKKTKTIIYLNSGLKYGRYDEDIFKKVLQALEPMYETYFH
jgi:hypothetical protein